MRLKRLEIQNYKSLRDVAIEPTPLAVLVGPNAAGKTNLSDALDFLGDVYRLGLEAAVARKGGYENICFRQAKRSRAPIRFRVVLDMPEPKSISIDHSFEFKAKSQGIRAPFFISAEGLKVHLQTSKRRGELWLEAWRDGHELVSSTEGFANVIGSKLAETELMIPKIDRSLPSLALFGDLGSVGVFQFNPRSARESGVPTPNASLDRFGGNLPGVINLLQKSYPGEYSLLLSALKRIMPTLEGLEADFTHTRTLSLFIKEKGFGRPWTSEDISDGTIQAIALLAATFDPRFKLLVIEEPENSVHPWAIRNFVEAFRKASESKQIILTTHSPILVDQLRPEELWIIRKPGTETMIDPVLSLDPGLKDSWGKGLFTLAEYLDSGAVPEAVPAANS